MATAHKRVDFYESEEGLGVQATLLQMTQSATYNTKSSYSANTAQYPNHLVPFVEKHMKFIATHPSVNPEHYLANLRLITRIR